MQKLLLSSGTILFTAALMIYFIWQIPDPVYPSHEIKDEVVTDTFYFPITPANAIPGVIDTVNFHGYMGVCYGGGGYWIIDSVKAIHITIKQ